MTVADSTGKNEIWQAGHCNFKDLCNEKHRRKSSRKQALLFSIAATLKTTLVGLFEAVVSVYPSTSQSEKHSKNQLL